MEINGKKLSSWYTRIHNFILLLYVLHEISALIKDLHRKDVDSFGHSVKERKLGWRTKQARKETVEKGQVRERAFGEEEQSSKVKLLLG